MENHISVGQVYKSLEDERRGAVRTVTVQRVGHPNPIWPGRLKKDKVYAFCISRRGRRESQVAILVSRLLSKEFSLVVQPAVLSSGQDRAAGC